MNNYKNLVALLREYSTEVNPGIAALMLNAANALEIEVFNANEEVNK